MNKFFKLLLLFTSIIAIGLFYKNHLKKSRINVSDCPNNRYIANRKEYYEKNYKIFKERQIKFYIDDENGKCEKLLIKMNFLLH